MLVLYILSFELISHFFVFLMERRRQNSSYEMYSSPHEVYVGQYGNIPVSRMSTVDRPLIERRRVSTTGGNYPPNPVPQYRESHPARSDDDYYSWQQYYGPIGVPPVSVTLPPPSRYSYYPGLSTYYYPQFPPTQYYEESQNVQPMDKDFRSFLAETRRSQRSAMASFVNISVKIELLNYQFRITADTSQSIDYLAKLIEADFNFQIEQLEGKKIAPLMVRLILNSKSQPINFTHIIGDVLSTDDIVIVIHSDKQMNNVATDLSHSGMLLAIDKFRQSADQDDSILRKLLKSKKGFRLFAEYCYREYSLEYLLFWLEIELFIESPPETWLLIARYIHKNYLRHNSPLRLNLRHDIIDDIPLPTYDIVQQDQTLFDETQQDAYNVMKLHLLRGFMNTSGYQSWVSDPESDIRSYFIDFTPDYNMMLELTKSDIVDVFDLPENAPPQQVDYCRSVRENILEKVTTRYFHSFPFTGRYFQSGRNLKMKLVTKEKKLTKFFGEKPEYEEMKKQSRPLDNKVLSTSNSATMRERNGSVESEQTSIDPSIDVRQLKVKKLDKLEGFFGGRPSSELKRDDLMVQNNRKSILGKIKSDFHSSRSLENVKPDVQFHAKNDLSEDERRILKKRQKKLADVLGTKPDDNIMESQKSVPDAPNSDSEAPILRPLEGYDSDNDGSDSNTALDEFRDLILNYFDDLAKSKSNLPSTVELVGELVERQDKDIRMKRIEKLYNILGERISPVVLEKSRLSVIAGLAKNPSEKNASRKRFDKLHQKFGENIPAEAINSTIDYSKRAEQHISGIQTLERLINNQSNLEDMISEIYSGDVDDKLDDQTKLNKQKKMNKLQKFFGDNLNATILFEQTILKDLEDTIDDEYSGREEYDTLKSELDLLRERAKSLKGVNPDVIQRKESFNSAISKRKPAKLNGSLHGSLREKPATIDLSTAPHKSLNELFSPGSPRASFIASQNPFNKLRKPPLPRATQSMADVTLERQNGTVDDTQPSTEESQLLSREKVPNRVEPEISVVSLTRKSVGDEIVSSYTE
eukprot:NODE_592_length_6322_cov_0.357063.p1 type:complete len:1037 gc:universal NODE_592_length_6322_cov_0.357063:509-3619(+)